MVRGSTASIHAPVSITKKGDLRRSAPERVRVVVVEHVAGAQGRGKIMIALWHKTSDALGY